MTDEDDEGSARALVTLVRRYGRGYRWQVALGAVTAVVAVVLSQLTPVVLGIAIDALFTGNRTLAEALPLVPDGWIPGTTTGQFWLTVGIVAALYGLGAIAGFTSDYLWGNFAQHIQHEVRTDAYESAQRRDMAYFDDTQTGEVMSVLNNDVNKLENFFTQIVSMGIRVVVMLSAIAVVMLLLHWQLALVSLGVVPVLLGLTRLFEQRASPKYEEKRERVGKLNGRLENNVGGIQTIKTYGTEPEERERVEESSAGYRDVAWAAFLERVRFIFSVSGMNAVGFTVTFVVGGYWVLFGAPSVFTGALSVGTLVTFLMYSQRFQFPMYQFAGVMDGYQKARAAAGRIVDLTSSAGEVTDSEDATDLVVTEGHVEYDDVTFSYEGGESPSDSDGSSGEETDPRDGETAVEDVSFTAESGDFVGLVGPTGAGKSTTMKLLPRLYDVDEGAVRVDGQDVREVTLESLRKSVGYVSQEPYLFTGTVTENVAYGAGDVTEDDIVRAAKLAGAHEFVTDLSEGYDTEVGERGVKLSGGQRQRIAIARALLRDPEILVLDEATSHVDNETEAVIQEHLADMAAERTTFAIAHRLSTVRDADTILVFDEGELVEQGTHEELLDADGLYANLWRVQVGEVDSLPEEFVERAHVVSDD